MFKLRGGGGEEEGNEAELKLIPTTEKSMAFLTIIIRLAQANVSWKRVSISYLTIFKSPGPKFLHSNIRISS